MPNKTSAIKRVRQNEKRRAHNRGARAAVRSTIKEARNAAQAGNKEQAQQLLKAAEKAMSKAARKGLFHKKNAARKISRLAKAVK